MNIHDTDKINEGRELGKLEMAAIFIQKGHSLEEVAEFSGIKIEVLKDYLKDKENNSINS